VLSASRATCAQSNNGRGTGISCARVEKLFEHAFVALADLAKHPTDGLVNEIVRVAEQGR
jgi:hypothetical protein